MMENILLYSEFYTQASFLQMYPSVFWSCLTSKFLLPSYSYVCKEWKSNMMILRFEKKKNGKLIFSIIMDLFSQDSDTPTHVVDL